MKQVKEKIWYNISTKIWIDIFNIKTTHISAKVHFDVKLRVADIVVNMLHTNVYRDLQSRLNIV